MKIALLKPPRDTYSHFMENCESLALGYLASVLRNKGFKVDILDSSLQNFNIEKTVNFLSTLSSDLIGITIADPTYLGATRKIITCIRKKGIDTHITIGGHTPTFEYKNILKEFDGLSSIVRFEGEKAIVDLASAIKEKRGWRMINNIAFKENGRVISNPPNSLISNLDDLPFPSRDYLDFIKKSNKDDSLTISILSSRGCYYDCSFCSIRSFYGTPEGQLWRQRSVSNVLDEIEFLIKNWGIYDFIFVDDLFLGPPKSIYTRANEFIREIKKRNLKFIFSISERADHINEELFRKLRDIGLRQVLLGIESGNQDVLNLINKKITPEQNRKAVRILKKLEIDTAISFINFFPSTKLEDLYDNLNFLSMLKVNFLPGFLNKLQIYRGTKLAQKYISENRVFGDYLKFDYEFEDKRTKIAFNIIKNTAGPILSIAYKIQKIERNLRGKIFKSEHFVNKSTDVSICKRYFEKVTSNIFNSAANIFKQVLDYSNSESGGKSFRDFKDKIGKDLIKKYHIWSKELLLLSDFSPF